MPDRLSAHEAVVLRPEGVHGNHPAYEWNHLPVPECASHGCVPVYSLWLDWKLVAQPTPNDGDERA